MAIPRLGVALAHAGLVEDVRCANQIVDECGLTVAEVADDGDIPHKPRMRHQRRQVLGGIDRLRHLLLDEVEILDLQRRDDRLRDRLGVLFLRSGLDALSVDLDCRRVVFFLLVQHHGRLLFADVIAVQTAAGVAELLLVVIHPLVVTVFDHGRVVVVVRVQYRPGVIAKLVVEVLVGVLHGVFFSRKGLRRGT